MPHALNPCEPQDLLAYYNAVYGLYKQPTTVGRYYLVANRSNTAVMTYRQTYYAPGCGVPDFAYIGPVETLGPGASRTYDMMTVITDPPIPPNARVDAAIVSDQPARVEISLAGPTPTPTATPTPLPHVYLPIVQSRNPVAAIASTPTPVVCGGAVAGITALDKRAEYVRIEGQGDMTDWYLLSTNGGQRFDFPQGYMLSLHVEVWSGVAPFYHSQGRLWWTEAGVWNDTAPDTAELYDCQGRQVSRMEG